MTSSDSTFDDIVQGLDFEVLDEEVTDVTGLDDLELVRLNEKVRQELLRTPSTRADGSTSNQMLDPTTDAGRELHSRRVALMVELARRGLR